MEVIILFLVTFGVVFVSELGDKSQVVTAVATLSNRTDRLLIFLATALALTLITGATIHLTNFIPDAWLSSLITIGGLALIAYGLYILYEISQTKTAQDGSIIRDSKRHWSLFWQQFSIIAVNELGDKTQVASFGIALANPNEQPIVFAGATAALISVTGLTILATKYVPLSWSKSIQVAGAVLLIAFGGYMLFSS